MTNTPERWKTSISTPKTAALQRDTADSAEGHGSNLGYFKDERATNCLGQLEQALWVGEGLMSQQRPGKRGMCSALGPTSDDCSRITACTSSNILRRLSFPPLYPSNRSAPVCIFDSSITRLSLSHVCRRHDRDKLASIYCALQFKGFWSMTAQEIDSAYWINAIIKHDACSSKNTKKLLCSQARSSWNSWV